jgi:hypothetical protein
MQEKSESISIGTPVRCCWISKDHSFSYTLLLLYIQIILIYFIINPIRQARRMLLYYCGE